MVTVDNSSRLAARKQIMNWVYKTKTADGKNINVADKLFDDIAPKYKSKNGGYTRIYKLGPRRGDAAEIVILELV
jgi:large subunit ribosomal protein L17